MADYTRHVHGNPPNIDTTPTEGPLMKDQKASGGPSGIPRSKTSKPILPPGSSMRLKGMTKRKKTKKKAG